MKESVPGRQGCREPAEGDVVGAFRCRVWTDDSTPAPWTVGSKKPFPVPLFMAAGCVGVLRANVELFTANLTLKV